ncbi:MAG: sugar phosphate isomerase/epimerase [Burkholderiales bacterium]|nr:sugar phosphate isomerase/epimerase [Burkholderiales bacterium]ODU56536.1 MAG: hypothetical protein ABS99_05770 [Acetobacteraceae bacterium SCN 69-10]
MNPQKLTLGFLTIADVPPADVVRNGAKAGFDAVGLRVTGRYVGDPWFDVIGNRETIRDIRNAADNSIIRLSNVAGFYLDGITTLKDCIPVFQTSAELGIRLMVQGCFDPDEERLVASLRAHCKEAAAHGIRVGIEFMQASAVRTLSQAVKLIDRVGSDNAGLVIDALHLSRSDDSLQALARIPSRDIFLFQICDAVREKPTDVTYMEEALNGRLYPGTGELPLADMLACIPAGTEIECEMPCASDRGLPAQQRAERAFRHTSEFLARQTNTER